MSDARPCDQHLDLFNFKPLPNFAEALRHKRKVKVVAVGSSSTAGADGVLPYPPRLEMFLRQGFYRPVIDGLQHRDRGQEGPGGIARVWACRIPETARPP